MRRHGIAPAIKRRQRSVSLRDSASTAGRSRDSFALRLVRTHRPILGRGGRPVRRPAPDRSLSIAPNQARYRPSRCVAPSLTMSTGSGPGVRRPAASVPGNVWRDRPRVGPLPPIIIPDTYQPNLACFWRFGAFLRVRIAHIPVRCHRVLNSCGAKNSGFREK
jgi:hypothetical protein